MGMGNAIIGALRVVLGMDSASFNDGVGAAQKRVAAFRKDMQRTGRTLSRAGARMTAGLTAPLVGLAYKSVAAQKEQERAIASVSAALESMGDGAGYTLSQLEEMASALQEKSLYGDEAILSKVTANLLTFGNISGDVFARAQQAAVDLSARLGQDLQSSAIMLGKALNDPVQGLSALSRVGVSFTEEQKALIKAMAEAGDVAGAQAVMLAELERQYKGQAEALANTDSGKITQAMNAIGDAMEKVGAIILPILADIAGYVKGLAERFQELSPETQRFVVIVGGLAAAIGPVVAGLGLMLTALAPLAGVVLALLSPFGLLAAAVTAVGVAIYANWEGLKEDFPAITGVIEQALSVLKEAFAALFEAGRIAFDGIKAALHGLAVGIEAMLNGEFGAVWEAGVQVIKDFGADVLDALAQLLVDVVEAALNIGYEIVAGIKRGLQEKWEDLKAYVGGLGTGIAQGFKDVLGIHSPSRVFKSFGGYIIDGLVQGIKGGLGLVSGAVAQMSDALNMSEVKGEAEQTENAFAEIGKTANSVFGGIGKLIGEGIRGFKSFEEVLAGVAKSLAKFLAQQAKAALVSKVGGSGSLAGTLLGGLFSGLVGFANGGSFDVGGAGGIDSQVVAFRASPNESVHITKPGQTLGDGPPMTAHLVVESSEDLRVVAADAGRTSSMQVIQASNRMIQQDQRRG
ncbi:phage tail length tape measure family protein [Pacificoceanicola onchidii]|uniref:phage tail length tape measure family protein n=1 Tax=Pacificoceanicola onchidii TaxID=2562685 RepID=UPI0010A41A08|nr:phage tail length tape measure family protein [Pacificoceanicola onchidii]